MINLKVFNVTQLATNCCYLIDESTKKSAVTDPGDRSDELISEIEKNGSKLEYIFLTHGHFDHIGYAKQLADKFGAKIVTGRVIANFLLTLTIISASITENLLSRSMLIYY